jgi:hypothetical protein
MKTLWRDFLTQQGAVWSENQQQIDTFGMPEIERHMMRHGAVMTDLSNGGLIRIGGADAKSFLQSQLTQDVNLITETQAQLAAYCDPQGQVLGLGVLFLYEGAYYWSVSRDRVLPLLSRLKMFVLRSQVELEDFSDLLIRIGYAGVHAEQDLLVMMNITLSPQPYTQRSLADIELDEVTMIRLPTSHPTAFFIGTLPQMIELWEQLETNATMVGSQDWALMDLAYGMPIVSSAIAARFKAHELNLDAIGAINFKKGCYPGQEIIARMQYRGKPTKRLTRFHAQSVLSCTSGDVLEVSYEDDRKQRLEVVSVGPDLNEGSLLLAVASIKGLEDAQGEFFTADGSSLLMEPMGYKLA